MRDAFQTSSTRSSTTSRMAGLVREAVPEATAALLDGDAERAEQVISNDVEIDDLREKLEEHSFELLSLQNPVAGDLRMLVARCGWSASSSGWATSSVHVAKIARLRVPDVAVPDRGASRRSRGWPRSPR